MKSKIEALENKARIEFEQLKLQSEAKSKQSSEDHDSSDTVDDTLVGDYNDVGLDDIVEIKQKNECGIDFLTKNQKEGVSKTNKVVNLMELIVEII